jgi:5'-3' exoribonuclease 1
MYDPNSTIIDFYPLHFGQDLNGKKQDWEAIVKIPFIEEKRLLKAMAGKSFPSFVKCKSDHSL